MYQENHSFDNLYGGWEGVDGIADAATAHTTQVSQAGAPYQCLLQNDVNFTSPPLPATCTSTTPGVRQPLHERAVPDRRLHRARRDTTCPAPGVFAPNGVPKGSGLPGGCTRDLVHRFYQEQYQLDGGRQNRYVTGSDAVGLTMGYYDTRKLPVYEYLHERGHPNYVDLRPLLPGRVRRLVPQPPVARRGGHSGVPRRPRPTGRPTTCTRSSTPTGCRPAYPLYTRDRRRQGRRR